MWRGVWRSVIVKKLWWLCADKLYQQFQKIYSRHCSISGSDWNYWPPLVVYLIANNTESEDVCCNRFWKKSKTAHPWQILQRKVNVWNEMWTCEWTVSDSTVKDLNTTVKERLHTKGLDYHIQVKNVLMTAANYTNSAFVCNKFTKNNKKNWTLWSHHFPLKNSDFVAFFKNALREFHCTFLIPTTLIHTTV
jgi:hypothetical protein